MSEVHDGKVRCNTVEYTMGFFLYSDWLYFLWHSIKIKGLHTGAPHPASADV